MNPQSCAIQDVMQTAWHSQRDKSSNHIDWYSEFCLLPFSFSKAHQLSSLLDQQEQALRQTPAGYDSPGADPVIRDYDAVGG